MISSSSFFITSRAALFCTRCNRVIIIFTMVSGIEHLSPGKSDNETLVFSLLYACEEKQKEQEQEFKYDLSKAKGNFAQMRTEFDEFDWSCILDTSIN